MSGFGDPGQMVFACDHVFPGKMLVRLVVASSIERMLDYIMNIGELTINLRHATLNLEKA